MVFTSEHRANMAKRVVTDETRHRLSRAHMGNDHAKSAPVKGDCVYCGDPAQTLDHVQPRIHGPKCQGACDRVPACWRCNASKGNRTPDEWLAAGLVALP